MAGKFRLFPWQRRGYGPPMSLTASQIIAELVALLGADSVLTEPARMAVYLNEPRKRFHVPATAVVLPRSVAEVQAVARFAHANGVALIPQGGNTGLVG